MARESIGVEVKAIDGVGNVGDTASDTLTAQSPDLTPDDIGDGNGATDVPLDPEPASVEGNSAVRAAAFAATSSSSYREILCSGGGPCGKYNGLNAAGYAVRWDLAREAGGMRFMRAHGLNSPNADDPDAASKFLRGEGSWWSYYQDVPLGGTSCTVRDYTVSTSFVRSQTLYDHLIDYALGDIVGPGGKVHAGDIVFYNLHGLSLDGLDHTQIVTRVTRHSIWVAQHSPGYNQPLRDVIDRNNTPEHRLNVDWRYIIVHPKHTAANIVP